MDELLYDSEADRQRHFGAVLMLAERHQVPVEEALQLYEAELRTLRDVARVKTYLAMLAARHVALILRAQRARTPPPP